MLLKNKVFSSLGSSFEWFDFALYGFFAPIFSKIFFSHEQSKWMTLIITYAIFAIGFAARPIGALIFGYLGDKRGRVFSLKITPLLIAFTSLIISFLPTYQTIGSTAVLLLLITRIMQGILLGGEFAGNIVYLCESSLNWKYFWGSIGSCTGSLGIILASSTASLFYNFFSNEFMYSYGWRLAFFISFPLGILVYFARTTMSESPEFTVNAVNNPIIEIIKHHKEKLLLCLGLLYLHATSFYFVFMFLPIFLTKIRYVPECVALLKNTEFLILHLLFIPLFSFGIKKIGGLKFNILTSLIFLSSIIPLFYLIAYGSETQMFFSLFIFSIITSLNAAVIPGLLAHIIPAHIRYTLLAFVFNFGFGIFGGIMPFLGLVLIHKTSILLSPAIYLTFVSAVTLVVGYSIIKVKKYEIREIPSSG